jgi:tRNA A-37 threonylcarbamoyl transferase component Bud32
MPLPAATHNRTPLYANWRERYEIVRRIGSGGFADVYEAFDRKLERAVALKVIDERRSMSGRVVREVEAAASLAHPGIVALYDFFSDGEHSVLVWELVEGETIDKVADELGDADAVAVVEQLAAALSYAHSQGVVHRDVKPQNVMLADDGHVKVMDFGIARLIDAETLTTDGDVLGTVAYMSPEQAEARRVGPASDVYSSGILLYELLAGYNPVRGATTAETMANVIAGRFTPLEDVRRDLPRDVTDAVDAACAWEPSERPSARELCDGLQAVLDDGRLGGRRMLRRPGRLLKPLGRLVRFAGLGERLLAAVLGAAVCGSVLSTLSAYPRGWTFPLWVFSAALLFVLPPLGMAWLLGLLAFPLFNVSLGLGAAYLAFALVFYALVRSRPLTGLWPVLAIVLAPFSLAFLAAAAAAVFGRVRGPLVAAWTGAVTLFYLTLRHSTGGPFTGFSPRSTLARQMTSAADPFTVAYRVARVVASPASIFQMLVWAGFALAVWYMVRPRRLEGRLWAWSLACSMLFVLYGLVPLRVWHRQVRLGGLLLSVSLAAVVILLPLLLSAGADSGEGSDECAAID